MNEANDLSAIGRLELDDRANGFGGHGDAVNGEDTDNTQVRVDPDQIVFYFQNTGGKTRKQNWYWGTPKNLVTNTEEFHSKKLKDKADHKSVHPLSQHKWANRPAARICIPKCTKWNVNDFLVVWEWRNPDKIPNRVVLNDAKFVVQLQHLLSIHQDRHGSPILSLDDFYFNFTDVVYSTNRVSRFKSNFVYMLSIIRDIGTDTEQLVAPPSRLFGILAEPKKPIKAAKKDENSKWVVRIQGANAPSVHCEGAMLSADLVKNLSRACFGPHTASINSSPPPMQAFGYPPGAHQYYHEGPPTIHPYEINPGMAYIGRPNWAERTANGTVLAPVPHYVQNNIMQHHVHDGLMHDGQLPPPPEMMEHPGVQLPPFPEIMPHQDDTCGPVLCDQRHFGEMATFYDDGNQPAKRARTMMEQTHIRPDMQEGAMSTTCPVSYMKQVEFHGEVHVLKDLDVRGSLMAREICKPAKRDQQKNIKPMVKGLDAIRSLKLREYECNDGSAPDTVGQKQYGVVADELPSDLAKELLTQDGEYVRENQFQWLTMRAAQSLDTKQSEIQTKLNDITQKANKCHLLLEDMMEKMDVSGRAVESSKNRLNKIEQNSESHDVTDSGYYVIPELANLQTNNNSLIYPVPTSSHIWYAPVMHSFGELDKHIGKLSRADFLHHCQSLFNKVMQLFGVLADTGAARMVVPLTRRRDLFPKYCHKAFFRKMKVNSDPIDTTGAEKLKKFTHGLIGIAIHMGESFFDPDILGGLPETEHTREAMKKTLQEQKSMLRLCSSQPCCVVLCRRRSNGRHTQSKLQGKMKNGIIESWAADVARNKPKEYHRSLASVMQATRCAKKDQFTRYDPLLYNPKVAADGRGVQIFLADRSF